MDNDHKQDEVTPTIEAYLDQVARFVEDDYGKMMRSHFQDHRGSSELGMLATPTAEELVELQRAVAIMTTKEKAEAAQLSDEQIQQIAEDAKVDSAKLAIFMNGYALTCQRVSCPSKSDTEI